MALIWLVAQLDQIQVYNLLILTGWLVVCE